MFRYSLILPALVLAGCSGTSYTYDKASSDSDATDTEVNQDDSDDPTGETSDSEDPTDDDDTTDDPDDPTDTEEPTDTEVPESDCHPWDPVDNNTFTRVYDVVYEGERGKEEQAGKGLDLTSSSDIAYRVTTALTTSSNSWDGSMYFSCDNYTEEGGLHLLEWSVDLTMGGIPLKQVVGVHSDPRMNLPPEAQMGSIGSWSYRYDLEASPMGFPTTIPVVGTYTEAGTEEITVSAGTFDAYKLENSYVMDMTEASTFYPDAENIEADATYYYAEGIGLVYELTVDSNTGETIMEKELTSYSGL